MKSFYILFILLILSCSCFKEEPLPKKPNFPDTNLKEVIIYGDYSSENPNYVEELKKDYIENGYLKEGETFEEKYPEFLDRGEERFQFETTNYCYNKTKEEDRNRPMLNKNLRVRVYDKEGKMIYEDFVRLLYPEDYDEDGRYSEAYLKQYENNYHKPTAKDGLSDSSRLVIIYLPYYDNKEVKFNIVRLEGEKEIILSEGVYAVAITKSELISNYLAEDFFDNFGVDLYGFDEDSQCHYDFYKPR